MKEGLRGVSDRPSPIEKKLTEVFGENPVDKLRELSEIYGVTDREIADIMGEESKSTIKSWRRKYGIKKLRRVYDPHFI